MRTLRIALAFLLLAVGCSSTEAGQPRPGDEPPLSPGRSDGPGETSEKPSPGGGPERPRNIDLTAVDICGVVAKLPLREYGLDGDRPPVGGTSALFPGNADCFAGGIRNNLSLTLIAVTDQDAGDFVETANAQVTDFEAEGYPLSVLKPARRANCFGVLDVHDGQFVWVAYGLGSPAERPVTPQDRLCDTVPMIAASAVTALG